MARTITSRTLESLALVELDALYERHKGPLDSAAVDAAGRIQALLRKVAYINERTYGGTHAEAVRHQNKILRRVRKATGYTYPKQDITF
jgi:hypothetical protein